DTTLTLTTPHLTITQLTLTPISPDQLRTTNRTGTTNNPLHLVEWQPVDAGGPQADQGTVAVVGPDPLGLAQMLSDAVVFADLDELRTAEDGIPARILVTCVGEDPRRETDDVPAATHALVGEVAVLAQRWLGDEVFAASELVVVTRRAVAVRTGPEVRDLPASAVWGLVRSARTENPERFALLDLDGSGADGDAITTALAAHAPEAAVRDGAAYVPRLVRADDARGVLAPPEGEGAWRLDVTRRGTLENLAFVSHPEGDAPLRDGEVRVAMRAGGLNFRDVMIGLGMYPGDDARIGGEGAGVVIEAGPGVSRFAPGDRVFGMFPSGGLGPVGVTDERLLGRVPTGMSFQQAAVVPVVYLTAYYGLVDLAGLRAGERLLVHAAAGGVGMAAVQIARHLGAEVYGTASPGKQDTLRALGLDDAHLANSRTTDFEQHFRTTTDGHGMDVVLDALAREFVDASLRLLPRGGRFLEIGKTDIRDADEVAAAHPGVRYAAYDVQDAGPDRIREMLDELLALFEAGALTPPPITAWGLANAPEALRFLSQAQHVGKTLLSVPRELDPEGTVLITGATGSLGRLLAHHLTTHHGVRHLL
ncbi:zinc-binding dehydrogenase, partial [Streptomyces sp. NPDC046915]|uniref:zinc-binding dehydrogenase n=1 Tax=Streptomyces sp. NPDC046915 TaxID=3155257 RepID=UPI0033EE4A80